MDNDIKCAINLACELCLNSTISTDFLKVFDENGKKLRIAEIILKHFWFKVIEEENDDCRVICAECWSKVNEFHNFYESVERAHSKMLETTPSDEPMKNEIMHDLLELEIKSELDNDSDGAGNYSCNETQSSPESVKSDDSSDDHDQSEYNGENITDKVSVKKEKKSAESNKRKKDADKLLLEHYSMECKDCSIKNETFKDLLAHFKKVHNIKGYVECCNRKFYVRTRAVQHMNGHLNPEMFKCTTCDKTCKTKQILANHMLMHVPESEKIFKCTQCPKSLSTLNSLRKHEKNHTELTAKLFSCDVCEKAFSSKGTLQTHIKGVHERAYEQMCDICAKVFKSKSSYEQHYKSFHEATKIERIQCNICGSKLKDNHSFKKHMRRHMEPNIKCDICGKEAPNSNALRVHKQRSHFAKRIYQCSVCDKSFKRELSLKEHMATHTGEVLYQCNFCPITFNSSANMYTHKKKKHYAEWQEWKLTSKDNIYK